MTDVVMLLAIVLAALIGSHPVLAVAAILYGGMKLRQSESLLCRCMCPEWKRTKVLAFGKVIG